MCTSCTCQLYRLNTQITRVSTLQHISVSCLKWHIKVNYTVIGTTKLGGHVECTCQSSGTKCGPACWHVKTFPIDLCDLVHDLHLLPFSCTHAFFGGLSSLILSAFPDQFKSLFTNLLVKYLPCIIQNSSLSWSIFLWSTLFTYCNSPHPVILTRMHSALLSSDIQDQLGVSWWGEFYWMKTVQRRSGCAVRLGCQLFHLFQFSVDHIRIGLHNVFQCLPR